MRKKKIQATAHINLADYTEGLKERLETAGISYGALSRQAKIDRSQISRWMNTPMQPSLANVARLERALEELKK